MKKKDREAFIEDMLAITSPDYLQSIQEVKEVQGVLLKGSGGAKGAR